MVESIFNQTQTLLEMLLWLLGSPELLIITFVAVCIGIAVGSVPGMSASVGVAVLLPLAYAFEPVTALLFFFGLYLGAQFGGSVTAILINTPGTTAAAATTFDGYSMTQKGNAGQALMVALIASVIGGIFSVFVLIYFAPAFANFALSFGPAEIAAITIFGLSLVSAVSGSQLGKGIVAALFGIFIATMGRDPFSGAARLTFGWDYLQSGIGFIVALIGLFAVSELLRVAETIRSNTADLDSDSGEDGSQVSVGSLGLSYRLFREMTPTIGVGSVIGVIVGFLPGSGSTLGSFLSYGISQKISKNGDEYGEGTPEGVAASESANNASTGGAMVPLLVLGIPGSGTTAVMLGALNIINITPGPSLFIDHRELVFQWFAGFLIANVFLLIAAFLLLRLFIRVLELPRGLLFSLVTILVIIGSYSISNSLRGVWLMFGMGIIGYVLRKFDFPLGPMVLAIVLAPLMEQSLRQTTAIHQGQLMPIVTKPIVLLMLVLSLLTFFYPYINTARTKVLKH